MPDSHRLTAKLHYKSFHQSMANVQELQRAGETFMRERAARPPSEAGAHSQPSESEVGFSECTICFDNLSDAIFLPCGHGGLCYSCAVRVLKMNTSCSLCRKAVIQVLRVDLNTVFETYVRVLSTTHILPSSEERKADVMEARVG